MTAEYNTYILELIRNNEMPQKNIAGENKFVMLDYFDVMRYKELKDEEKTYMNYFSIADAFGGGQQSKASYKTLSLYQHKKMITGNPFMTEDVKEDCLSERPFLGVIQICLCKESYSNKILAAGNVDDFLEKMEQEILQAAGGVLSSGQEGGTVMQLYRSSTTGDFCLVMRTDAIEDIYRVASRLNNSRNNSGDSFKVLTYTNVGIESRAVEKSEEAGLKYCTFSPLFLDKYGEDIIAIRFSADSHVFGAMEKNMGKSLLKKGLFGRYDYLLHIKIKDFAEIYPEICRRKFGELNDMQAQPAGLGELIMNPRVRNINERILVDCKEASVEDPETNCIEIGQEECRKNNELFIQIAALDSYQCDFSEETQVFRDLHRGTQELYKAFSSTAMEKDAVLNWYIWHNDMKILCACIQEEMGIYAALQDERKKKELRINLLSSWRTSLQAISKYTRLVQNVNYQTYQSPLYEMQTQVDTEKVMVAYREAMRVYVQAYADDKRAHKIRASRIEPIIYPELTEDQVRIAAPFTGTWGKDSCEQRSIFCMVPSFEYFGRLYDLLPWIFHEASHQLRVLSREERNEFVVGYIFKHIFKEVVESIVRRNSDTGGYVAAGLSVKNLLNSFCFVAEQEMKEEMHKYSKAQGESPSYEQMVYMTAVYLDSVFPYDNKENRSFDTIKEDFFNILLDRMKKEEFSEQKNKKCQADLTDKLERVKKDGKNVALAETLVGQLINKYKDKAVSLLIKAGIEGEKLTWLNEEDLHLPLRRYEKRVLDICGELGKDISKCRAILKEYFFEVKPLYNIFWEYSRSQEGSAGSDKRIQEFLRKVYKEYKKRNQAGKDGGFEEFLEDPAIKHILRTAGMAGDEDDFCSRNLEAFKKISSSAIQEIKRFRTSTYREACADLLMAVSLGLTGFGYCRQVLQIVSDAKIEHNTYIYDDIDYNRFRIVAAVLIAAESEKKLRCEEDECWIDCSELIEQGRQYCLGTLRCIRDKMLEQKEIQGNSRESELVQDFVGDIYKQLTAYLGNVQEMPYKSTLLYVFLHGEQEDIDKRLRIRWKRYKGITGKCDGFRHQFWRLECFCRGLDSILSDGKIVVERDLFEHMLKIYGETLGRGENKRGCKWESQMWECMWNAKQDVGSFYNDPAKVYLKTSEEKLENTIEFIQNFYYHNRLNTVREGGWFSA